MMKQLVRVGVFAALVCLIACSGGPAGDPKAAAEKFFHALKTMNFEEAEKYATKDSKSMLDLLKMGMSFTPNQDSLKAEMEKQKIKYSDAVIDGDEATVTVTVDEKEKTDFKLKKEEGEWKVAFDKSTLMQMGMDKAKEKGVSEDELKQAQEALETLSSDSMKDALKQAAESVIEKGKE